MYAFNKLIQLCTFHWQIQIFQLIFFLFHHIIVVCTASKLICYLKRVQISKKKGSTVISIVEKFCKEFDRFSYKKKFDEPFFCWSLSFFFNRFKATSFWMANSLSACVCVNVFVMHANMQNSITIIFKRIAIQLSCWSEFRILGELLRELNRYIGVSISNQGMKCTLHFNDSMKQTWRKREKKVMEETKYHKNTSSWRNAGNFMSKIKFAINRGYWTKG